jgi:hypothetical protein
MLQRREQPIVALVQLIDGSSSTYMTPSGRADLRRSIRCASPPDSVSAERSSADT